MILETNLKGGIKHPFPPSKSLKIAKVKYFCSPYYAVHIFIDSASVGLSNLLFCSTLYKSNNVIHKYAVKYNYENIGSDFSSHVEFKKEFMTLNHKKKRVERTKVIKYLL